MIKNFNSWLNEAEQKTKFIEQGDKRISDELNDLIEDYISEEIFNWEEGANSEEEGEALEFFGDTVRAIDTYRIYPDGTISVQAEAPGGFDFEWEDEDGEKQTSNMLNLLKGKVVTKFDDSDTSGDNKVYDENLKKEIVKIF